MADQKDQAEVRFTVDAKFLNQLQEKMGVDKTTDVARSALTLLNWAVGEVKAGRIIVSSTMNGEDVHRLVMPELTSVR